MTLRPAPRTILLPMRVWDGAIRLFHWSLVLLMIASYASVSLASGTATEPMVQLHVASGEAVLGLLVFRLIWGVIGSDTARFSRFVRSPAEGLRHLAAFGRRAPDLEIGHGAAGGWMVLLMLGLLAVQVATGLFSHGRSATEGTLAKYVSKALAETLYAVHSASFNILIAAVILHVAAIAAYYFVKGQNLVRPMITGKKRLPAATRAPRMGNPILAGAVIAVSAGLAVLVAWL